jgi:hypothetical protein
MSSFAAASNFSGTGSVTTVAGFRAYAPLQSFALPSFTGTVTNYIGLLIDDITGTTDIGSRVTNKWGIYQSGSLDKNYFAGATTFANGITGSLEGTASYALTASYAMNGGGGGLSALYIQDEGVTQGTASYIDFVGTGVTATVSNGTASVSITGGGTGVGQSVVFTQASPATTWTFNHNLNSQYLVYDVYDSNSNAIIPANVSASSANTLIISFGVATAGYVVATVGGGLPFISSSFNGYVLTASGSTAVWAPTSSFNVASASFAISASYAATASFVTLAQTASFVQNAQTASYVLNAVSASFVSGAVYTTGNQTINGLKTFTDNTSFNKNAFLEGSGSTNYMLSFKQPTTLLYPGAGYTGIGAFDNYRLEFYFNQGGSNSKTFAFNAGNIPLNTTVGLNIPATGGTLLVDSLVSGSVATASLALTASYVLNAVSASHAVTASSADNFTVRGTLTAQTIVAQTVSSSIIYSSGSNIFGNSLANTQVLTGSVTVTGSLAVNGSNVILTNQTSSMSVATASYVLNAVSASFASTANSSSFALVATSASFAATASYATNFTVANTLILDATLTDYASVASSIVGSNNIFTQNTGSYTSAFFKYTVRNGANTRAGEAIVAWNGTTVSYTDFSTVDIGDTSAVTASAAIVAGQIQFNMQTNSSGWSIKSIGTFM